MTVTEAPTITRKAEVPLNGFRAALSAHLLTVGKDELLPALTGVKITVADGVLRMESTDRYRLTVTEQKLSEPGEEFVALILGADVARVFKTLPKATRGMPGGGVVFLSAKEEAPANRIFRVGTYDGSITALDQSADLDFPKLGYIIEGHTPAAVERFGINPAYLAALAKMPRDKNTAVTFSLADVGKPVHVTWEHESVDFRHIIMPMRVSS